MIPDLQQPGQDVTPVIDFLWRQLALKAGLRLRILTHSAELTAGLEAKGAVQARPNETAHAAVCWWGALGTMTMADDLTLLDALAKGLRQGAPVAIDLINAPRMLRDHKPTVTAFHFTAQGQVRLDRATGLDIAAGRLKQRFTWTIDETNQEVAEQQVRLVMPHEVTHMLETTGFETPTLYGDITGRPYEWGSDRCIALTKRLG